ncbi:MAG TPA: S8/S53 family peptidase [Ktedonobacteraceae bacterium]|nr:S8/S53 family peptidase [Ktedonobacteraceae bacterium]
MPQGDIAAWSELSMSWIEDQVAVTFHSTKPFYGSSPQEIIASLHLNNLNQFLNNRGFNLSTVSLEDIPRPVKEDQGRAKDERERREEPLEAVVEEGIEALKRRIEALEQLLQHSSRDVHTEPSEKGGDLNDLRGKYLFPSSSGSGTDVMGFFSIDQVPMPHPIQDLRVANQTGGCCQDGSNTRQVVNLINSNLNLLRRSGKVPLLAASPNWLGDGTPVCHNGGGPGAPPIPVPTKDSCDAEPGYWPIKLPDLSSHCSPIAGMTGEGVTVFVLDTMPELQPDDILKAAKRAGKHNLLLHEIAQEMMRSVSPYIRREYQYLPDHLRENADDQITTGQDIYGRPYGFDMEDHGLFVTGIVRDLARGANIHYRRVLNDRGTFDMLTLMDALQKIQQLMLKSVDEGGLQGRPVVINLSLVVAPPQEELLGVWLGSNGSIPPDVLSQIKSSSDLLLIGLRTIIQNLTALGAVIVAAAGNDSNNPATPERRGPRYPAAFPEVISVGAVDKCYRAASYSNFPVLPPNHNGVATYGGSRPIPVPPVGPSGTIPLGTVGPDPRTSTAARDVDSPIGVFSSHHYPKLVAEDRPPDYEAADEHAWAYWSGTSFATPIISAVAARVLQKFQELKIPHHLWSIEAMRAITTAIGQYQWLTGDHALELQSDFTYDSGVHVGLLKAYQCVEAKDCSDTGDSEKR